MYHNNNKINSEKEIKASKEEFAVFGKVCNKPTELPKPKLERHIAFNIKDFPASNLWSDIVFNPNPNIEFDTKSDEEDDEEEKWDCIDLLNRILCNCKLISYKKRRDRCG